MNIQSRLEQFRSDNPYDTDTQAKRLLAAGDKELILYTLALGLVTARQRQQHYERDFIKNVGEAPERERLIPRRGGSTGSVVSIKVAPSKKHLNATKQLILDVWKLGDKNLGDCNSIDLTDAIKREDASSAGHGKNAELYRAILAPLNKDGKQKVSEKWDQKLIRNQIEKVYGEFRTQQAGDAA